LTHILFCPCPADFYYCYNKTVITIGQPIIVVGQKINVLKKGKMKKIKAQARILCPTCNVRLDPYIIRSNFYQRKKKKIEN